MITGEEERLTMPTKNPHLHNGVRKEAPCKSCPPEEKYSACHDTCEKFRNWKVDTEQSKAALKTYEERYYKSPRRYLERFKKG